MSTATTELRRFLTITGQRFKDGRSAPEMFSPAADKAWHDLLGTPAYAALCQETARQSIRHVADNRHGPIAWVRGRERSQWPVRRGVPGLPRRDHRIDQLPLLIGEITPPAS